MNKEDAIVELMEKYGDAAKIELYHTKVKKKEVIRYRFVNVPIMANYPYGFKSIESAMVCLKMHESGMVFRNKQRKYRDTAFGIPL